MTMMLLTMAQRTHGLRSVVSFALGLCAIGLMVLAGFGLAYGLRRWWRRLMLGGAASGEAPAPARGGQRRGASPSDDAGARR